MDGNATLHASKGLATTVAAVALTFGLFTTQTQAAGVWTNEPAGAAVVLDCTFSSTPSACGILDVYSSSIQDSDGSAPVSPAGTVRSTIYPGQTSGGMQLNYVTPQLYNEMYMGLIWRSNTGFYGRTSANKLFFIRSSVSNGFWGWDIPSGGTAGPIYFGHNTGGLDNSHTCSYDMGLKCFPNVNAVNVRKGEWAKIEAYVKKSTTATSRDGIVRWWVNGILSGNYSNINYGWAGLNEWMWTETWDGTVTNPTPVVEWSHYLDHLHISIPGRNNSADQPPGPPASPTIRNVTTP